MLYHAGWSWYLAKAPSLGQNSWTPALGVMAARNSQLSPFLAYCPWTDESLSLGGYTWALLQRLFKSVTDGHRSTKCWFSSQEETCCVMWLRLWCSLWDEVQAGLQQRPCYVLSCLLPCLCLRALTQESLCHPLPGYPTQLVSNDKQSSLFYQITLSLMCVWTHNIYRHTGLL